MTVMTSREIVKRAIRFENPERLPYRFEDKHGCDFCFINMVPSPDDRLSNGIDEWGAVWENIGEHRLGEVKEYPLNSWNDFDAIKIPDIHDPKRWLPFENARAEAGDKFMQCRGISLYERIHFIRGLENTWMDIYGERENLCKLLDILVDMNLVAIERFAEAGADGFFFTDDWGLQDRLMIDPEIWREIWKPRYERMFQAAHDGGMHTFMHSCGYIVDILDDLIESGLDVIQMDQQENMGLEFLGGRFGGRITFWSPVDIQTIMPRNNVDEIRQYCRKMVKLLGRREGGFIPRCYADPVGAGHSPESTDAMCEEFLRLAVLKDEWGTLR